MRTMEVSSCLYRQKVTLTVSREGGMPMKTGLGEAIPILGYCNEGQDTSTY
jgi:hypothetical protein